MKGARGLLISITGGRDLTLYEVDEAATRIREEVDQDANIIVGATFDEGLEGIIRVSVVARHRPGLRATPAGSGRGVAHRRVAQRLRADNQRLRNASSGRSRCGPLSRRRRRRPLPSTSRSNRPGLQSRPPSFRRARAKRS